MTQTIDAAVDAHWRTMSLSFSVALTYYLNILFNGLVLEQMWLQRTNDGRCLLWINMQGSCERCSIAPGEPTKTQEVKARMESIQAMQKDAKGIKIRPTRAVLLSPSLGVSRSLYVGYVWDLQLFLCHANSHNTCCGQTCLEVQYPCDFSWLLEKNRCIRGSVVESQI